MKITNETELMYNQKGSLKVAPDKQFKALQTIEGNSLLFSVGLDNILFCTCEVPGDTHGWTRVDLSSYIFQRDFPDAYAQKLSFTVKNFDIAQDFCDVNTIDIVMIVTVNNVDYLYIATGFTNTLGNWAKSVPPFVQFKFDYPGENIPACQVMPINDVQILDS